MLKKKISFMLGTRLLSLLDGNCRDEGLTEEIIVDLRSHFVCTIE
jgi:hypothetical protein